MYHGLLALLSCEEGIDRGRELVTALEEVELKHEDKTEEIASKFLYEGASCICRAA